MFELYAAGVCLLTLAAGFGDAGRSNPFTTNPIAQLSGVAVTLLLILSVFLYGFGGLGVLFALSLGALFAATVFNRQSLAPLLIFVCAIGGAVLLLLAAVSGAVDAG